jgi:hypothetical protein
VEHTAIQHYGFRFSLIEAQSLIFSRKDIGGRDEIKSIIWAILRIYYTWRQSRVGPDGNSA